MSKDVLIAAENDKYIIETRVMVRRQQKLINELMDELNSTRKNSIFAIAFAAASAAFTIGMALTFVI